MSRHMLSVERFLHNYEISRSEFYRQVHSGKLRMIKRGRRSFILQDDADSWLDSLEEFPSSKGKKK